MEGTLYYSIRDGEYKHIGELKDLNVVTDPDPGLNNDILRYIRNDETALLNMSLKVFEAKLMCKLCGLSYYEFTHPRHKQRRRAKLKRYARKRRMDLDKIFTSKEC